ncbi:MAG TPA: phosphoribosylformylglycinamidine synthase subunit PurL [Chloroflexota bacterium]|jgi:phosphoribosylformylglycinamidine synthase II|nr:phosphoribosylformylglycinamidine synthase subunit PurL [Chloroflexota bacterium]
MSRSATPTPRPAPGAGESQPPTAAQLREVALTQDEYELICQRLGRRPNAVELGMCGAMWSEHCGYKNSKPLLRRFRARSIEGAARVLVGAGEENAGAVDIGDGLAAIFKIESHNHPSAVEPFQGAATGVGGIVRDIFTMGARPIAILDSLRFGPLDDPQRGARNRYLFEGVVGGIAHYGNCIGVPTVGGEVVFAPSYSENPLVNAMCVGVAEKGKLVSARATGAGNSVLLVGADTGRDGLHGATFASVDDPQASHRGVVQVGDPFREKLLIEACLEVLDAPWLVAMQDLGAAGLTSSSVECASKGHSGIEIDVARVSRRETGMTPYEVMLSESQERMLVIVRRGHEAEAQAVFARWGLHSDVIGEVTEDNLVRVRDGAEVVAELPHTLLTDPPLYVRQGVEAGHIRARRERDLSALPVPQDLNATLLRLLAAPNLASKRVVYRRYDHTVQTNTVQAPGGDAAVLRLKGTRRALAMATDGNGRYCFLDPLMGGRIAVAEAARNVSCTGATPVAATDCLNFGNPEKPEVYYQLQQAIEGMAQACEALGTPVISGNVSLYNESAGEPIYPTPIVGVLGILEDVTRHCPSTFQRSGDLVVLLGETRESLGASEYLEVVHGLVAGQVPELDLDLEAGVQALCRAAIERGLLHSAHDCSDGGLAVALVECCTGPFGLPADDASSQREVIGASLEIPSAWRALRADAVLFGETPSRILVSLDPAHWPALEALARRHGVPLHRLGTTGGDRVRVAPVLDLSLEEALTTYATALERALL